MKLQEFSQLKKTNQVSRVFESHFGSAMSFDQLTAAQCRNMLGRVQKVLGETRRSAGFHTSEQNPAYLKLVMMEQALSARLKETMPAPGSPGTAPGSTAPNAQQVAQALATQKDPKVKAALEKAAKGQSLNPEEQKIVAGVALTKTESKLRNAYRMLKESEVQQAQVVLAAQDMVDKMQGMLEDVSELQFKELPALVDSIKNQVGIDQATQFNTDATAALTGLMQNLQGAKQQLDQALGVVTGQQPAGVPGMDAGADLAAAGADLGAADQAADAGMDDLDAAAAEAGADFAPPPEEEEPAPAAALGRGRR